MAGRGFLLDDVDLVKLADPAHGLGWNDQHFLFTEGDEDPTEHPAVDVGGTRPGDLDLEGPAFGLRLGHDLGDRGMAIQIQGIEPRRHLLTDLEPHRQRLTHRGHHLHAVPIVHRQEPLAGGNRVAGVDLLVDDDPANRGVDRGIGQQDLGLLDRLPRPIELGLRREIGRVCLLEFLLRNGIDGTQPLGPLDVEVGLVRFCGGARFRRFRLPQTRWRSASSSTTSSAPARTVCPAFTLNSLTRARILDATVTSWMAGWCQRPTRSWAA